MKNILISVVKTWLCATGVAVIASYCILTNHQNTSSGQKQAAKAAARISKQGTIPEYKSKNRHSSAVKKTTTAKVVKEVKVPTYVPNPLYPSFTNALNQLTAEVADMAKDGVVKLNSGFVLALTDGKPTLKFHEAYGKVAIGGITMGDELACWTADARLKGIDGTDQKKVDEVALSKFKRLDEPEFYCTDVTYSLLPATKQVDAIRMHGKLNVGNTSKANEMMKEIAKWMKEDYGAVDLGVAPQAGTLALKKFKIGKGMDVEVSVKWNQQKAAGQDDAYIDISFVTGELVEENRAQRQELGQTMDEERIRTRYNTGVNYYTVRPKVNVDNVKRKVVYW